MAGMILAPTIVANATTKILTPTKYSPSRAFEMAFAENKALGEDGTVTGGHSRQPWEVTVDMTIELRTATEIFSPRLIEAEADAIEALLVAAASNYQFTFYEYYDSANATGIGWQGCELRGFSVQPGFMRTVAPQIVAQFPLSFRFKANDTINRHLVSHINQGTTNYSAPSTPTTTVSDGLQVRGTLTIANSDGSVIYDKVSSSSWEYTGSLIARSVIT